MGELKQYGVWATSKEDSQWEDKAPHGKHLGDKMFTSPRGTVSACQWAYKWSSVNAGDQAILNT